MNHIELGALGEELAEKYLEKNGFQVIAKNVRFKKWEVDIIAQYLEIIVFVEVKTRHTTVIGEPWHAVNKSKQKQIIQVANHYLCSNAIEKESRFDIVSIIYNEKRAVIEHISDAFYPLV